MSTSQRHIDFMDKAENAKAYVNQVFCASLQSKSPAFKKFVMDLQGDEEFHYLFLGWKFMLEEDDDETWEEFIYHLKSVERVGFFVEAHMPVYEKFKFNKEYQPISYIATEYFEPFYVYGETLGDVLAEVKKIGDEKFEVIVSAAQESQFKTVKKK